MKKFFYSLAGIILFTICFFLSFNASAQTEDGERANFVSPNIVISQIYGGGGTNSSSNYTNDFVELFNRGNAAVSLNGWSIQYASSGGTEFLVTPLPDVTLQPGQYFLIQYASSGANGSPLPAPDFTAPAVTNNSGNTFIPNLSSTTGKIALVNSTVRLPASTCPVSVSIVDLIGYGSAASCFEGMRTPDLTVSTALKRKGEGCVDTDNNNADTIIVAPAPRNMSSPTTSCNLGASLQAGISANPATIAPGGTTLLTVSVIPATTPPSSSITVVGNLSDIGGSASQTFYDDGTNGDVTANDNVFSYRATIPAETSGGVYTITAVVTDAQTRSVSLTRSINVNAPLPNDNPLLLGNPSNATADIANENNYLMVKPQYQLSYNRSKATANWVAWRLDNSWLGSADRQDDFRPDPDLPAGWYQVTPQDYTGSGYDRGHMTPSGDRTRTVTDNSATFLMTNIVPQLAANNQGPWNDFENYLRTLAQQGQEIYIFSGPAGIAGTIAQGKIVVPLATWKVVLILPNGSNDLQRISKATRAFGIIVPNQPPLSQSAPWRQFRVTVDAVENLTGFNFFTEIPKNTQELIERKRDKE